MSSTFYLSDFSIYAPGLESDEDFKLWANNQKEISLEKQSPSLNYTDPLFRRRLSQLSKMTIEVVHNLIEKTKIDLNTKIVFSSFRGEIEREFKLNQSIIENQMILPAGFSLSVFNAPIALATMACNLKAGYSTIFPTDENFTDCFLCAASSILAGTQEKILFVYADELIPEQYKNFAPAKKYPIAFATIISKNPIQNLPSIEYSINKIHKNVYDFIKKHLTKCYTFMCKEGTYV